VRRWKAKGLTERPVSMNRSFIGLVKIIVLVSGSFLCSIAIIFSSIALYLYYHPERIKSTVEKSLSAATGSSCTIESLSGSLQTGVIEARGVVFEAPGPQRAFLLALPFIRADLTLGGPWGHRSLILENIQINDISVHLTLPACLPGVKSSSDTAGMIQSLVGIFLFRDIAFRSGEILGGHIEASWEGQTIRANQIHARAGMDKPLFLSFALDIQQASRNMRLTAPSVNILSANALDMNDLRLSDTLQADGPWQVNAKLSVADLVFHNKAGSLMGEKISFAAQIEGDVDFNRSSMTFAAFFEAKTGEALYARYYLNLAKNPVAASCKGTYRLQQKTLLLSEFRFDLKDILPLEINGLLSHGPGHDADLTVNIPQASLKPIFQLLLQEPYKTETPLLAALETGGTVSAEFRIKELKNSRQVTGRIGWRGGNIALPDRGISIKGIHMDLPVWYRTGSAQPPVETLKGKLEIQSAIFPPLPEQLLSMLVEVGPNRVSVDTPTVIHVPGGDLRLGPVKAENIFSPDISIQSHLACDGIKLRSLLSGIKVLPPQSTLSGMLDSIRFENNTVTCQGEIAADVFGGKIIVSDLGVSGLLTSAPVFRFNAYWDDLLLAEMTTDTPFGKIEGVLKGRINDVEIAYGQPQKFVLLLETVPKKGVPQTISIQAVDNIAQIGGGQSPFVGMAGAFASVFKKFSYEKIGMQAGLENDMFTINGTIREDGTEYLVKRRSFSGVNIVNQNPDNRISFKDMMKRIQRITHKGGMVVE